MSIIFTRPAEPKSINTIALTPAPVDSSTVPRPYLSWLTRSPTARTRLELRPLAAPKLGVEL